MTELADVRTAFGRELAWQSNKRGAAAGVLRQGRMEASRGRFQPSSVARSPTCSSREPRDRRRSPGERRSLRSADHCSEDGVVLHFSGGRAPRRSVAVGADEARSAVSSWRGNPCTADVFARLRFARDEWRSPG